MSRFISRLTYANVVATLALFVALGGAGYAAIKLPNNSVGTKQLRNGSVSGAKIKKGAVTATSLAPGAVTQTLGTVPSATNAAHATSADDAAHATSADSAKNAAELGGTPASGFATAGVVRSALVEGGTVVPDASFGISQSNVSSNEPGVYCVEGLTPRPITAVVGNALGAKEIDAAVLYYSVNSEGQCEVYVETRDNKTNRIPGTFTILIR